MAGAHPPLSWVDGVPGAGPWEQRAAGPPPASPFPAVPGGAAPGASAKQRISSRPECTAVLTRVGAACWSPSPRLATGGRGWGVLGLGMRGLLLHRARAPGPGARGPLSCGNVSFCAGCPGGGGQGARKYPTPAAPSPGVVAAPEGLGGVVPGAVRGAGDGLQPLLSVGPRPVTPITLRPCSRLRKS